MKWFKNIFRHRRQQEQNPPHPLQIGGTGDAPLTPEPDEAELAAQAVLETMCYDRCKKGDTSPLPSEGTREYYEELAGKIRAARETARQRTVRFLVYCEQTLRQQDLPMTGPNSLSLIETELYKRIDTVEREGGELKRRWQHCLADVTVRMMKETEV